MKEVGVREEGRVGSPLSAGRRQRKAGLGQSAELCVFSLCVCQHSRSEMGEQEARSLKTYRCRGFMPYFSGNQQHHSELHSPHGAGARWRQTPLD